MLKLRIHFYSLLQHTVFALAFILTMGSASIAWAGNFSVSPVRLFMHPSDRALAVTIENDGSTEIVLQAEVYKWQQNAQGQDELTPSDDLILSPPVLKLAGNAKQVVRLAKFAAPSDSENKASTYRLVVREVPQPSAQASEGIQLPISLVLSMPVFMVSPQSSYAITCTSLELKANGKATIACENKGSAYTQIRRASIKNGTTVLANFQGGTYILPGAQKIIELDITNKSLFDTNNAKVELQYDDEKSQTFALPLP